VYNVQESQLSAQEKLITQLRQELSSLKEQESVSQTENKSMTSEVSEMKLQLEKLVYESKEAAITSDAMREQNGELERELEELRVRLPLFRTVSGSRTLTDSATRVHVEILDGSQEQPEECRTRRERQETSRKDGSYHG
jgi:hypothetical protein